MPLSYEAHGRRGEEGQKKENDREEEMSTKHLGSRSWLQRRKGGTWNPKKSFWVNPKPGAEGEMTQSKYKRGGGQRRPVEDGCNFKTAPLGHPVFEGK